MPLLQNAFFLLYVDTHPYDFINKKILFNNMTKNIEIGHHTTLLSSSVANSKLFCCC